MPDVSVTAAYVHDLMVSKSWHDSMMASFMRDLSSAGMLARGGYLGVRYGTGGIVEARNKVAATFLDTRHSDWLWWTDTDMGWGDDALEILVESADPKERPIVGGLCFMRKEIGLDGMGGMRAIPAPTVFHWHVNPNGVGGYKSDFTYPKDTLIRCDATGSAFILIHRSVLARMRDEYGDTWYSPVRNPTDGSIMSEDLSFCARAVMLDIPVHINTAAKTSHLKEEHLDERVFDIWVDGTEARGARAREVPVAVIVPAMRRPHRVAPFMESLRSSTENATAYFVCDQDDTEQIAAVLAAGAEVITNQSASHTFATKANLGYRSTSEPWLLFVGDDVRFQSGWKESALIAAGDRHHLVATNDLGNRAVMAGQHATHPLIRREWLDTHGASWDGPGTVAHEGYAHWFVDNEWSTVARMAGVFVFSPESVIEHLHPIWGKGEDDEVYRLGQSKASADQALWERRCKEHVG